MIPGRCFPPCARKYRLISGSPVQIPGRIPRWIFARASRETSRSVVRIVTQPAKVVVNPPDKRAILRGNLAGVLVRGG